MIICVNYRPTQAFSLAGLDKYLMPLSQMTVDFVFTKYLHFVP